MERPYSIFKSTVVLDTVILATTPSTSGFVSCVLMMDNTVSFFCSDPLDYTSRIKEPSIHFTDERTDPVELEIDCYPIEETSFNLLNQQQVPSGVHTGSDKDEEEEPSSQSQYGNSLDDQTVPHQQSLNEQSEEDGESDDNCRPASLVSLIPED